MTLRQYILSMSVATILCLGAWVFVLFSMRPDVGGAFAILLFYTTFFCVVSGVFSIVGFAVRRLWQPGAMITRHVATAFRQSLFFASLVVAVLVLQHFGELRWATFFITVGIATFLEFLILAFRRPRRLHSHYLSEKI